MREIKAYGLIGYPLGHSWSKAYFTEKFSKEDLSHCSYSLYPLKEISGLPSLLAGNPALVGLNVTIPYKEEVLTYLDELSSSAAAVGAVNTLLIKRSMNRMRLLGFNTDIYGFEKSLDMHNISSPVKGSLTGALVLGSGGASKAVCHVLTQRGWKVSLVSRNREASKQATHHVFTYEELTKKVIESHLLIVNTTPLGMHPNTGSYPAIPYQFLTPSHILYDLVYNPTVTRFLEMGGHAGCKIVGGLDMLRLQAEQSWDIWSAA